MKDSNRFHDLIRNDEGMTTIEYAMGSLAAAAMAAVLYAVVKGDTVVSAIEDIISNALSSTP
ncbi:DUF4244 domain-containing protein [Corynebacterium canis]|uniref:DUF4244 domain-containing protein n=1 Tax=Corynebacterium canis TaxID=679663 RepID=A0A5C5UI44_9CORY|nr:DUF4244 domain-containing protein [Corynebacterium canis]TWT25658.1 DUF4244 domain-containing protein [Corynebacterium canis]WJY74037.1 hypothetical protein CCANI_00870 [Corynebacterium canis]